jgi:hypothetical protein
MSKKNHRPGPVPPGNQPQSGPAYTPGKDDEGQDAENTQDGAPFQEQDPERRLGGFETAGEHAIQQPSRLNDGETRSK